MGAIHSYVTGACRHSRRTRAIKKRRKTSPSQMKPKNWPGLPKVPIGFFRRALEGFFVIEFHTQLLLCSFVHVIIVSYQLSWLY